MDVTYVVNQKFWKPTRINDGAKTDLNLSIMYTIDAIFHLCKPSFKEKEMSYSKSIICVMWLYFDRI